ncbi:hypothetical protein IQ231_16960 [Cuspidothrix issatschenkoi LEGE 03284]|uniref:hypothetical protein n=1 Tax=Cuspidothrix issatschenkoi TaxID=230752 RepID=UPI00187F7078|nr:hypothetical protein [Cuspidothrix issatschenkoi]MBE9233314.1 hypothetical protein [Cuspidothrix issatschenkoi LEGE 03284]
MINPDYAHPDPAWDYAQPYEELLQLKSDLDHFIAWLGSHEEADRDTDKVAKAKLDSLINQLSEIRKNF